MRTRGTRTLEWQRFRRQYLRGKRNHEGYYVCERCGRWSERIELHHRRKRSLAPELRLEPRNIELVCHRCHLRVHHLHN